MPPCVNISQMEVVRRQYLSHIKDNSVTIRPDGIQFNTACIVRMEDVVHIQMIIGRQQRWLVICKLSCPRSISYR